MGSINKPWQVRIKPFRIINNLYFVGTQAASSHLIDTGEGLILIDSGYPQTLYLLIQSIWELGLNPKDLRIILHTHGHYDHLGATRALVELFGAKTYIGKQDEQYANGSIDLTWAKELGYQYYEEFEPSVLLDDGDVISLGNTEILIKSAPGHTPGTISLFFNVTDKGTTYRVGMHGGVGMNSMKKEFLLKHGLPLSLRDDFLNGLEKLKQEKVDIMLGNHVWHNNTVEKYQLSLTHHENPFINQNEWPAFLESCRDNLLKLLLSEE